MRFRKRERDRAIEITSKHFASVVASHFNERKYIT
jgi:hypothetical protein